MPITSVQVFVGQGQDLLWDWVSGLSSASHCYVLHGRAIWVGGCRVLCQIVKLHRLWEILQADLVLGGDIAHPVDHSLVIVLQVMQVRWGWGTGFTCMKHITADAQTLLLEVMGNEQEVRMGRSSLNQNLVIEVHNHRQRTSSPRGNRRMTPPQASPCPLWPLSLLSSSLACPLYTYT